MLLAGLDLPPLCRVEMQWPLPGHIPWDKIDKERWSQLSSQTHLGPTSFSPVGGTSLSSVPGQLDFDSPLSQFDSSTAFHAWSAAFETRAAESMSCPIAAVDRSYRGRASCIKPKQRRVQAPILKHSRQGEHAQADGFLNRAVGRWFQQLRRLQSYRHAACSTRSEANFVSRAELWNSILRAHGFVGGFASWWATRPIKHQGAPWIFPLMPPSGETARLILDDFVQNYRSFEQWQQARRAESTQSKLLASSKAMYGLTRKPAKATLDGLEDTHAQTITVVDTARSLVSAPEVFRSDGALYWTLQDQLVSVTPVADALQLDTDLILASGQTLKCHTWIHDTAEIHKRLENLWSPWWNRHADLPESAWDTACEFADQHLQGPPIDLPEITHDDWHKAIHSFKQSAAAGPDGWTRADLIHCSSDQIQAVLDFYKAWEQGAPCPTQWNIGLVHCLQKRESSAQVNDFRPITVLSMFYRVYAGIRAGQILAQLSARADMFQSGFLRGRQAQDVWYFVGSCLEVSFQTGTEVFGAVADLVKAYNTLPRKATFHVLRRLGLPAWFVTLWSRYLDNFCRYFLVGKCVGPAILSSSGYPEGCPLSCVAMTALDLMWHAFQNRASPASIHLSFVDNLEIVSSSFASLDSSLQALSEFCRMLDLQLDLTSFYTWSSSSQGRTQLKQAGHRVSLGQRDLGGQVTYCQQLRNRVLQDRIASVIPYFVRLRSSRAPFRVKIANLVQVLWPRALHGCEAVQIGSQHLQKLRSGAMKALKWSRGGASPVIRFGLLHWTCDPEWYQLRCVLRTFRHQLKTNYVIRDWWGIFSQDLAEVETHGPFGKLLALMSELNLQIDAEGRLWFSERGNIDLTECSIDVVERVVRLFFFRAQTAAVSHRQGYEDLQGFDYDLTTELDSTLTISDKAHLDIVRDGSFISDNMKAKYDVRVSPTCQTCHVEASRAHKYGNCGLYADLRLRYPQLFEHWDEYPSCFQLYGLLPENPWQILVWEALQSIPDKTDSFLLEPQGTIWHCFIDGACQDAIHGADALASWAVVLADRGVVSSGPVVGIQQTSLRAEITAVLSALKWGAKAHGSFHLWVDNQTVVGTLRALLQGTCDLSHLDHVDLWKQIKWLIDNATALIRVHKVCSHVSPDCSESPTEDFAIFWNDIADTQASLANQVRPQWFWRIWDRFQSHRRCWRDRMRQLVSFHLAVAQRDCDTGREDESEEEDVREPLYSFAREINEATLSVQISAVRDHLEFGINHDPIFRRVTLHFADWLRSQDESAAEARTVSLLEIFVGYRLYRNSGPLSLGGVGSNCYQAVTFASDFGFFKRIFKFLREQAQFSLSPQKVDLSHVNIVAPQTGVQIGWSHAVEEDVFVALTAFVGMRPVKNHQGFARPWHV